MSVYHVYCDESSHNKHHSHMVIGAVIVGSRVGRQVSQSIEDWRDEKNMKAEIKWQKCSDQKQDEYKDFATRSINQAVQRRMAFHALVVRNRDIDYKTFHEGNIDLGIYKLTYQLILHKLVPLMDEGDDLVVFPDKKDTKCDLEDFRHALQAGIARRYGRSRNSVRKVEHVCSKKTNIGQVNDVLMGAVAFQNNGRHLLAESKPSKVALAEHIAQEVGLPDLCQDTPREMRHFGVWQFRFKTPKK